MVVSRVTNGVVDDVACWMSEKKKKKNSTRAAWKIEK